MMTPEDVLIEAIMAIAQNGDTPELRAKMCAKLQCAVAAETAMAVLLATQPRSHD